MLFRSAGDHRDFALCRFLEQFVGTPDVPADCRSLYAANLRVNALQHQYDRAALANHHGCRSIDHCSINGRILLRPTLHPRQRCDFRDEMSMINPLEVVQILLLAFVVRQITPDMKAEL